MKRISLKCLLAVVLVLSAASAMAGPLTFTIYTNYNQWWQATQTWQHYPFAAGQSLNPATSVLSTVGSFGPARGVWPPAGVTPLPVPPNTGAGPDVWNDRVTVDFGETTTFWITGLDMQAFGGYWDFSPALHGQGLTLTVTLLPSGSEHVQDICGDPVCLGGPSQSTSVPDGTWFGIVANEPFGSFTISADHQGGSAETYGLASLDMARTPEPGTLILLGAGILSLASTLRRKLL